MVNHSADNAARGAVAGLVLAAGKGTRMRSALPKVLQPVAGQPMLSWTLAALKAAGIAKICLVLAEDRAGFDPFLAAHPGLNIAVQRNRQGTGDAVAAAAWSFAGVAAAPFASGYAHAGLPLVSSHVLILAGDVPGLTAGALNDFIAAALAAKTKLAVLGMEQANPTGYGRMQVGAVGLVAITEEKDADAAVKRLTLCNTGIMLAETALLFRLVAALTPQNLQGEYYLTDIVQLARAEGERVTAHTASDGAQFAGVNDRQQLAAVEERLIEAKRQALMAAGVSLRLPQTIYVEPGVEVGEDTLLDAGCHLSGRTKIGRGCIIGAHAVLKHTTVPPGEHVPPQSVRIQLEV